MASHGAEVCQNHARIVSDGGETLANAETEIDGDTSAIPSENDVAFFLVVAGCRQANGSVVLWRCALAEISVGRPMAACVLALARVHCCGFFCQSVCALRGSRDDGSLFLYFACASGWCRSGKAYGGSERNHRPCAFADPYSGRHGGAKACTQNFVPSNCAGILMIILLTL